MFQITEDRTLYEKAVATTDGIPLFFQSWWLDIVAKTEGWLPLVAVDKQGRPAMVWPVCWGRKKIFRGLSQPVLTPMSSYWPAADLSLTHTTRCVEAFTDYFKRLRPDFLTFSLSPTQSFQFPLDRLGYTEQVRYTYQLPTGSKEELWQNIRGNARTAVRKARPRFQLLEYPDPSEVYWQVTKSLSRQGKKWKASPEHFVTLVESCQMRQCGKQYVMQSVVDGSLQAGAFIVWDQQTTYCLARGGSLPGLRARALTLAVWEAIADSARRGTRFDFVGSHLPAVQSFIRSFGAEPQPFALIASYPNRWLRGMRRGR